MASELDYIRDKYHKYTTLLLTKEWRTRCILDFERPQKIPRKPVGNKRGAKARALSGAPPLASYVFFPHRLGRYRSKDLSGRLAQHLHPTRAAATGTQRPNV